LTIPPAQLQGLGNLLASDRIAAGEIGNRTGEAQDAVVCSAAEATACV
jgi:hypothetical protein